MKTQIMYLMTKVSIIHRSKKKTNWCRKATKFAIILADVAISLPNFLGLDRKLFAL